MTESEYLVSCDPAAMLTFLRDHHQSPYQLGEARWAWSDRKLRLFACACCRQAWDRLTDPRSRRAVEVAEKYADGEATDAEAAGAEVNASTAAMGTGRHGAPWLAGWAAATKTGGMFEHNFGLRLRTAAENGVPPAAQAALLRCLWGNPWRPSLIRHDGRLYQHTGSEKVTWPLPAHISSAYDHHFEEVGWLTPRVTALARAIYDGRDWAALPQLADALEEAGASDEQVLSHLRRAGPHARGCWALDLILGKG